MVKKRNMRQRMETCTVLNQRTVLIPRVVIRTAAVKVVTMVRSNNLLQTDSSTHVTAPQTETMSQHLIIAFQVMCDSLYHSTENLQMLKINIMIKPFVNEYKCVREDDFQT